MRRNTALLAATLVILSPVAIAERPEGTGSSLLTAAPGREAPSVSALGSGTASGEAGPVISQGADEGARPEEGAAVSTTPSEGIKIHGHWTIEVRDPDGTLVSRHEFENALRTDGGTLFTEILGRIKVPGRWTVTTTGTACGGSPTSSCVLVESTDPRTPSSNTFFNLSVTQSLVGGVPSLVLSGNATALLDGDITQVGTLNAFCIVAALTGPVECVAGPSNPVQPLVTATLLPVPIPALLGQQIQVTVTFQFS